MPELPDLEIFAKNLKKLFAGKKVTKIKVINGKKLFHNQAELSRNLVGKTIEDIYRSGKEMRMTISGGTIVGFHLMLTGDIFLFNDKNDYKSTIVEIHFNDGSGFALTDRMKNASIKLNPEEKKGVDAMSITYNQLKHILDRKAIIKNVLLDQNLIRGIGNGYSDEILWETRISPFSISKTLPDEKVRELAKAIKKVLKTAIKKISKAYPDITHGEVKDFHKIHTKNHTKSPTGAAIQIAARGMLKTYYTEEQVLYQE